MTSTALRSRVPAGTPTGGQFASESGQRAPIDLTDTTVAAAVRPNPRDPYRFDISINFPPRDHCSISQLTTWQRCQLQWALQQHGIDEQAPQEPTAAKRYADAVERRDRGVRFHAAAETTIASGATGADVDDETQRLLDGWRQAEPDLDPTRCRAEVEIRGYLVDETTGELVPFLGYADRIDTLPDATVRIVDYKSGASPYLGDDDEPDGDGVRRVRRRPDDGLTQAELQLLTYADQLGEPVSSIRVVYPATTRTSGPLVVDRAVTADNLAHARAVTAHLVGQMNAAERVGTVTTSDGAGCSTCGFHRHCPLQGGEPPRHLTTGES